MRKKRFVPPGFSQPPCLTFKTCFRLIEQIWLLILWYRMLKQKFTFLVGSTVLCASCASQAKLQSLARLLPQPQAQSCCQESSVRMCEFFFLLFFKDSTWMDDNSNHSKCVKQKNSHPGNRTTDDEPRYASCCSATEQGETVCAHPLSLVHQHPTRSSRLAFAVIIHDQNEHCQKGDTSPAACWREAKRLGWDGSGRLGTSCL